MKKSWFPKRRPASNAQPPENRRLWGWALFALLLVLMFAAPNMWAKICFALAAALCPSALHLPLNRNTKAVTAGVIAVLAVASILTTPPKAVPVDNLAAGESRGLVSVFKAHPDANANGDPHPKADGDTDAHSDPHAYPYPHADADPDS